VTDYDGEAARYDATRGGEARASAAADAIESLLSLAFPAFSAFSAQAFPAPAFPAPAPAFSAPAPARIADVGCGTGIVTVRLLRPGRSVVGVDRSASMAAIAAARLPGRITLGDVTRLPLTSGSVDVVTMVWLLHLLSPEDSAAAIAEAGRILAPGGVLVTTVAKNDAAYGEADDAGSILRPSRVRFGHDQADDLDRALEIGERCGLSLAGRTTFAGLGQGRSPRTWREHLLGGHLAWAASVDQGNIDSLCVALAALPDQERFRPDPVYQIVALSKAPRRPDHLPRS